MKGFLGVNQFFPVLGPAPGIFLGQASPHPLQRTLWYGWSRWLGFISKLHQDPVVALHSQHCVFWYPNCPPRPRRPIVRSPSRCTQVPVDRVADLWKFCAVEFATIAIRVTESLLELLPNRLPGRRSIARTTGKIVQLQRKADILLQQFYEVEKVCNPAYRYSN